MNIQDLLTGGIPVPEQLILSQAMVDGFGRLYLGVGWGAANGSQFGVWVKVKPGNRGIADGLAAVINGVRAEIGAQDDSPGVLTPAELANVLLGAVVGKPRQ